MISKKHPTILTLTLGLFWILTLAALGMTNAHASSPKIVVKEKAIKSNTDAIEINIKVPVLQGLQNQTLENKLNHQFLSDAKTFYQPIEKEAIKYLADTKKDPKMHFNKYAAYTTFQTTWNKNGVLSIPIRYYQYHGGANGLETQHAYNYDLKNDKKLTLHSLFRKGFDYQKFISAEVLRQMKKDPSKYFPESISGFKGIKYDQPYYLKNGNLVIFYDPIEIAPHAAGIPEFSIPLKKLKTVPSLLLN